MNTGEDLHTIKTLTYLLECEQQGLTPPNKTAQLVRYEILDPESKNVLFTTAIWLDSYDDRLYWYRWMYKDEEVEFHEAIRKIRTATRYTFIVQITEPNGDIFTAQYSTGSYFFKHQR